MASFVSVAAVAVTRSLGVSDVGLEKESGDAKNKPTGANGY